MFQINFNKVTKLFTLKPLYMNHIAGNNPIIENLVVNLDIANKIGKSWSKLGN